jgi:hypothetical protein
MSAETRRDVVLTAARLAADGARVVDAVDEAAPNAVLRAAAETFLADRLGVKSLARWDGHHTRTQAERVAALDDAAEALRAIE